MLTQLQVADNNFPTTPGGQSEQSGRRAFTTSGIGHPLPSSGFSNVSPKFATVKRFAKRPLNGIGLCRTEENL
jgi:hypothetical protein